MMEAFVDRLVEVKTNDDGVYQGLVVSVDTEKHELVLRKVKDMKTLERQNNLYLHGSQIVDLSMLDPNDTEKHDRKDVTSKGRKKKAKEKVEVEEDELEEGAAVEQQEQQQPDKNELLLDASDDGPSLFQMQRSYLTSDTPPPALDLNEPPQGMMVDSMGDEFIEAVTQIKQQKVISFAVEGRRIIRKGDISLLIFGTRQLVYIFDVASLGSQCISNGLASILEDQNLLKVVFDIRMVSDCLSSLYKVYPKNVFDCQAADIFIHKKRYGQYPSEVASLSECLQKYLNVPRSNCTFEADKKKIIQRNKKLWTDRPFPNDFRKHCCEAAMLIRELRPPMMQQLLAEFLMGVDIYLDCVRTMPDHTAKFFNPRKLPKAINSISAYKEKKTQQKNHNKNKEKQLSDNDADDYEERSPWDTGGFQAIYRERHGEMVECMEPKHPLLDSSKPLLKTTDKPKTPGERKTTKTAESLVQAKIDIERPKSAEANVVDRDRPKSSGEARNKHVKPKFDTGRSKSVGNTSTPKYVDDSPLLSNNSYDCNVGDLQSDVMNLNVSSNDFPTDIKIKPKDFTSNILDILAQAAEDSSETENRKPSLNPDENPDSCDDTKLFDEYQISTSEFESSDSDIFLSSVNDPPRNRAFKNPKNDIWPSRTPTDTMSQSAVPSCTMSKSTAPKTHTISNAGKRMILQNLPRAYTERLNNSYSPDHNEFPPLQGNAGNEQDCVLTNGHDEISENNKYHRVESSCKTPEMMSGIKEVTNTSLSLGRGQTLEILAYHSKKSSKSPRFLDDGKRQAYVFPSDDELLQVPHVAPMIGDKPITGHTISVTKQYPSNNLS